jgi:hypothetical protein
LDTDNAKLEINLLEFIKNKDIEEITAKAIQWDLENCCIWMEKGEINLE